MDASQMTCPKCGWVREMGAVECPACGIVYERYGGGPRKTPPEGTASSAFAPPSGEALNPYAPPQSNVQSTEAPGIFGMFHGSGVWRTGDLLVMQKGAVLPNRCLVCNQPASVQLPKKLYWHTPWLYVLILLNILIYLIAALVARKKAEVVLPLCNEHAEKRKRAATIGGMGMLFAVLLMFGSCTQIEGQGVAFPLMFFGGLLGLLGFAIFYAIGSNVIVPKKIDDYHVWMKKVSASYLAALPPAPPGR